MKKVILVDDDMEDDEQKVYTNTTSILLTFMNRITVMIVAERKIKKNNERE